IIEKKGQTLDFPALGDRVADKLYCQRLPIWLAMKEMPLGDRAELRRWKLTLSAMFGEALGEI
ncbi:MAG: hypothetical protein MJ041_05445, partial [Acidaminococcaceae bacterium]|nr:hypothetical protein [Acidaminococcaceae bacterium]